MRSFLHLLFVITMAAGVSACAHTARISSTIHKSWTAVRSTVSRPSKHKSNPALPPLRYAARTATLDVTFGLQVAGVAPLPDDFVPDMSRPPLWLQRGSAVGVIGTRTGKSVMLGFSGANLSRQRVVIEDYGAGAPGGRLLDVAASPDGHTLATVVAGASRDRLEVNLIDESSLSDTLRIANLDGEFNAAQLTWLSSGDIALATQAATPPASELTTETTTAAPVSGLYLITAGPPTSIRRLDGIKCPLSPLAFSPNDAFAVAQGTSTAPPQIIDVHAESCTGLPSGGPLQVLGWAPDSTAFLYRSADRNSVFRFDILAGRSATIAISSGAAAYASDGTIIALGSQELSWRRAVAEPMSRVKAQIALFDPHQSLTTINSLGFATQSALLAQSTMMFSQVSNDAIIDTAISGATGPVRLIIEYSYPARAAFVLAHGEVQGPVAISWSPDGKQIAIVDGDATHSILAVIAPPK
ncbi:MAG: hypothetical protein JO189_28790 [Deltaproteobacteria bacterium]|nr:hypothetical protein [Deltaproteobacteria bacterium]